MEVEFEAETKVKAEAEAEAEEYHFSRCVMDWNKISDNL